MSLDLSQADCIGEALRNASAIYKNKTILIESDRDTENRRWTFNQLRTDAECFAAKLQAAGFKSGDRLAIIMSNQSKWIITGLGAFWAGAILIPLDSKLTASEQMALLAHCRPKILVVEWILWEKLRREPQEPLSKTQVIVTEAPKDSDLGETSRWETSTTEAFCYQGRNRDDLATVIYSSGTGGRAKGCLLTHSNYLRQAETLADIGHISEKDATLSIIPTNHAIDFMCGFLLPLFCGAKIVHQRTLRAQYLVSTMRRYQITLMVLVPLLLRAFRQGIGEKLEALPDRKKRIFNALVAVNRLVTRKKPHVSFSRLLFKPIHDQFGGKLREIIVGGAFVDPSLAEFFYQIGLPVAIGYGATEAGTAITLNDLHPFRADTVGKPLPGTTVEVRNPDPSGVGEIYVKGPTVMKGYLDDPEMTNEVIIDGWLKTGDLGMMDRQGHLKLVGRAKNMIVTEGGKNIYPEDIEIAFEDLNGCKDYCIFAANYIWPTGKLLGEKLAIVVHPEKGHLHASLLEEIRVRNRTLADFKRISAYVLWDKDFPRTASMKIKRQQLADEIRASLNRETGMKDLD